MASTFSTILIPIDFTINTEVAIKKAVDLAMPGMTTLHLLHVAGDKMEKKDTSLAGPEDKMQQWKESIEEYGITVATWMIHGQSVQSSIAAKAKRILPDLLIIGKSSHHKWLPFMDTIRIHELAEQSGCTVLTVKPGSMHHSIRTIVVPVSQQLPKRKMEILSTLCKKHRIRVHLVSFSSEEKGADELSTSSLVKVYQWLKTTLYCPVEYTLLYGTNKPKTLLAYAEKINADTLLLQPDSETKIGWPERHISDLLPADSKMQVLTVQPPVESYH